MRTVKYCTTGLPLLFAVWFMAGCGSGAPDDELGVVSVSGTLYLDGAAYGPATLSLRPAVDDTIDPIDDLRPIVGGVVSDDGSFVLTTYAEGDGAPPGTYEVSLTGGDIASTDPSEMMAAMSGTPTEPLSIEIPAEGTSDLDIRLISTGEESAPIDVLDTAQ